MLVIRKEKLSLDNKRLRVTSSVFSLNGGKMRENIAELGNQQTLFYYSTPVSLVKIP